VKRDLDLQQIPKLVPFPKKRTTKKKVVIIIMKEEDEEGEKAEKVGKNWVDGEVLHIIALRKEMELEFTKNAKKQSKFNLLKP
jgi:5'-3' exonuclease